ncbi:MAG: GNAT family N-acetyltransferase [Firmicutes bacterium]|nr:GNAT family N-acetyltransferase [Bacillota bacterium]
MITYRKAESNDLDQILTLIRLGFSFQHNSTPDLQNGWEHYVLFRHLYSQPDHNLNWIYLAEQKGNLAAVVGAFPHQLSFEGNLIPVWAVSPVVSHPDYRGQGIAGKSLRWALHDLKSQGIPAVFLWGLPDYYPRFGFVPLLPRYKTKVTKKQLRQRSSKVNGYFRQIQPTDWEAVSALYNQGTLKFWLQPERTLDWWKRRTAENGLELAEIKEVPFPDIKHFLIWEKSGGKNSGKSNKNFEKAGPSAQAISGYLYFQEKQPQSKIYIDESAASDLETAMEMAITFINDYLAPEQTLYINGTPEHLLNIAAYRLGGTHINPAPLAGMIKVIDWPRFLKLFSPVLEKRLHGDLTSGCSARITNGSEGNESFLFKSNPYQIYLFRESTGEKIEFTLTADRTLAGNKHDAGPLVKLFFGLYETEDLIALNQSPSQLLNILFPKKYPFIWDKNYLY